MAATLRAPPPTCPSFSLPSRAFPHLGPGSIHPDGGFIFVFVCLLIHASSYSGHRKGLSFHHRMQIATAANPLSSLPCRHPTSLSVSPSLLQSGRVCFFGQYRIRRAVTRPASPPLLPYTPYMPSTMERLAPHPPLPPVPVPHRDRSEVLVTLPFLLKWRLAGASLIELARTRVALVISLLDWNNSDESGGQSVFFISHFTLPLPLRPLSLLQFL